MHLRPYRAEDRAACRAVFFRAVREGTADYYSEVQRSAWAPDPTPGKETPDRWLDQWAFVATRDGQIRGFMTMARDGYLDMAFVLPEEMRSGMAAALYDRLFAQARAAGLTRLTVRASIPSRNFLQKRGWRVEETRIFTDDGAPIENYLMALDPVSAVDAPTATG